MNSSWQIIEVVAIVNKHECRTERNRDKTSRKSISISVPNCMGGERERERRGMSYANFKAPTSPAFALTPAEAEAEPEVGWVSLSAHVTLSLVMNEASEVGFGSESFRFR